MENKSNNKILNLYNYYTGELQALSQMSNQIKANIAVKLLKHRLKSYIAEAT